MTKKYLRYAHALSLPLLLAACSDMATPKLPSFTPHKMEIRQGNLITPILREKIKAGMSRSQIRNILGTPLIMDAMHPNRWDYVYRFEKNYQLQERQQLTLFFENDRLQRIDDRNMPALRATSNEVTAP